ncbi:MAG TPA: hypothetical protein VGD37_07515 [Kofleriaceae bacterium]|jgi:hypothetical protein
MLMTPMLACGAIAQTTDPLGTGDDAPVTPPAFRLVTPGVDLAPGDDLTYCYYFRTSNTSDLSVRRWISHMTAGSEFMIVYLTATDMQPLGSQSTTDCGMANIVGPVWTYAATSADADVVLPADDGEGNPVGQPIRANQAGFIQMHYANSTSSVIHAHVELDAYAHAAGVDATPAGTFVAINRRISLASGSAANPTTDTVGGTCDVLPDSGKAARFYELTTHTYKQGVHTLVRDGATTLFDSRSWRTPGATTWKAPDFHSFASGQLTYQCEYSNPNNHSITNGNNAATDEICMAIGYYVPAASGTGHFCLNSATLY